MLRTLFRAILPVASVDVIHAQHPLPRIDHGEHLAFVPKEVGTTISSVPAAAPGGIAPARHVGQRPRPALRPRRSPPSPVPHPPGSPASRFISHLSTSMVRETGVPYFSALHRRRAIRAPHGLQGNRRETLRAGLGGRPAGGGSISRFICLTTRKMQNATITKIEDVVEKRAVADDRGLLR